MTDNLNDGASVPAVEPAPLKSSDTSELRVPRVVEAPKVEPKPEPEPLEVTEAQQEPDGDAGDEVDDDAPEADSSDDKPEGKSRWKKRLERVRRAAVAETEARLLREFQSRQQTEAPTPAPSADKTIADFDFDPDAYTAYLVDRRLEQKAKERAAEEAAIKQAEAAEKFEAKVSEFEAREGEGAWHEVSTSPINTDPKFKPLCDLFVGDDHDLDIALHLANDLPEAERLLSLSPLARARELGALAERFSAAPKAAPAKAPVAPPRKLTNAPPPPKTVAGAGKATVDVNDPSLTTAQRIALWKRQT